LTYFPTEPGSQQRPCVTCRKPGKCQIVLRRGCGFHVEEHKHEGRRKRNRTTGSRHSDDVSNCNCVAPARREYFCLVLLKDVPYTPPTFQHNVANNLPGIQAIGTRQTNPDCHIPSTSKGSPRRRSPPMWYVSLNAPYLFGRWVMRCSSTPVHPQFELPYWWR